MLEDLSAEAPSTESYSLPIGFFDCLNATSRILSRNRTEAMVRIEATNIFVWSKTLYFGLACLVTVALRAQIKTIELNFKNGLRFDGFDSIIT